MEFTENVLSLCAKRPEKFDLFDPKCPPSREVYFRAKQKEIISQYTAARTFLMKTETKDWSYWDDPIEDNETEQRHAELTYRASLYEASLIFYNIVVDLSWTMCYVAMEFSLPLKDKKDGVCEERIEIGTVKPIEEAYNLMRREEKLICGPTEDGNPFLYFKKVSPQFTKAIDLIIDFWEDFDKNTSIRHIYNYCKHRGKPLYNEIKELEHHNPVKFFTQHRNGNKTQQASDTADVQLNINLESAINELWRFDNEKLFPYISALINEIERVLKPDPRI